MKTNSCGLLLSLCLMACGAPGRPTGLPDPELQERVLADTAVKTLTSGKTIRKVVVGKGPIVSLVIQP